MPVPVSITHPTRHGHTEQSAYLESDGPFARLKARAAEQPDATSSSISNAAEVPQLNATPADHNGAACGPAIATQDLTYFYPGIDGRPLPGVGPVVQAMTMSLPPGSRTLLVGANGAGKTTLLKLLGGKHLVSEGMVRVLGKSPFHATGLTASGELSYLGGSWERDVAFAGYSVPLQGDFPASQMINGVPGVDPARKQRLIKVLDVNPDWRMHIVSDGQRRRVQLCLGLLRPYKVLLLDEITTDLDVLGRADLMAFLRAECEERGATIVYATHIFDGLESWPTHVAYVAGGALQLCKPAAELPELQQGHLLELMVRWLREERQQRKQRDDAVTQQGGDTAIELAQWSNGWTAGRLTSSLRNSSNAVMRM